MPPRNDETDERLMAHIAHGDEDAFVVLYRRRQAAIYRFAWQMSGSLAVAQDVTQEVFLVLMQRAGDFDAARGPAAAYLFGIARNLVRRVQRERGREAGGLDEVPEPADDQGTHDPAAGLVARERAEHVRRAIALLPEHYREVIALCDLEELSYADAAAALGQPVGTIRSRLHRARSLLASRLSTQARPVTAIGEPSPRWSS